jgi:hypothetical protein
MESNIMCQKNGDVNDDYQDKYNNWNKIKMKTGIIIIGIFFPIASFLHAFLPFYLPSFLPSIFLSPHLIFDDGSQRQVIKQISE